MEFIRPKNHSYSKSWHEPHLKKPIPKSMTFRVITLCKKHDIQAASTFTRVYVCVHPLSCPNQQRSCNSLVRFRSVVVPEWIELGVELARLRLSPSFLPYSLSGSEERLHIPYPSEGSVLFSRERERSILFFPLVRRWEKLCAKKGKIGKLGRKQSRAYKLISQLKP